MMRLRIIVILLISSFHISCCSQSYSYPVFVDVTKIEVTATSSGQVISDITAHSRINEIIRFIDERRSRWCSPRFASLPDAPVTLLFEINHDGKGKIGFGKGFFVADFMGGRYKMIISDNEVRDFLDLIGVKEERLFGLKS